MEHRVETGRKVIAEQRCRVERQRQFVSDLEATEHCEHVLRDARELLRQMLHNLHLMLEHLDRIKAARAASQQV
jgi:hypothetical protein